jgi:Fe2+ transport system protein FeoA
MLIRFQIERLNNKRKKMTLLGFNNNKQIVVIRNNCKHYEFDFLL